MEQEIKSQEYKEKLSNGANLANLRHAIYEKLADDIMKNMNSTTINDIREYTNTDCSNKIGELINTINYGRNNRSTYSNKTLIGSALISCLLLSNTHGGYKVGYSSVNFDILKNELKQKYDDLKIKENVDTKGLSLLYESCNSTIESLISLYQANEQLNMAKALIPSSNTLSTRKVAKNFNPLLRVYYGLGATVLKYLSSKEINFDHIASYIHKDCANEINNKVEQKRCVKNHDKYNKYIIGRLLIKNLQNKYPPATYKILNIIDIAFSRDPSDYKNLAQDFKTLLDELFYKHIVLTSENKNNDLLYNAYKEALTKLHKHYQEELKASTAPISFANSDDNISQPSTSGYYPQMTCHTQSSIPESSVNDSISKKRKLTTPDSIPFQVKALDLSMKDCHLIESKPSTKISITYNNNIHLASNSSPRKYY